MATIHLQGIGKVPAIPAGEAKPGMTMTYNFGTQHTILSVTPISPKFVQIEVEGNGKVYARRYMATRLIAAR
jgi:hypothetical protein